MGQRSEAAIGGDRSVAAVAFDRRYERCHPQVQAQVLGTTDVTEFELLPEFLAAIDARHDLAEREYAEPAVTCRTSFTNAWFEPLGAPATTSTPLHPRGGRAGHRAPPGRGAPRRRLVGLVGLRAQLR